MTDWLVRLVAFIAMSIVTVVAETRFLRAVERREPGAAAPDDEVLAQLVDRPSGFASIMVRATRRRLSALARRWPYPEVERFRRWALASIAVEIVVFAWYLANLGR